MNPQALEELKQILELVERANQVEGQLHVLDHAEHRLKVLIQQLEGGS